MRRRSPTGLLVALLLALLPGCASDSGLPQDPPPDYMLVVDACQVLDPPCDLTLSLGADGVLRYDIHHRGTKPSDRRGSQAPDPAAARAVWDAVLASGILDRPDTFLQQAGPVSGRLVMRLTSEGRVKTVVAMSGEDAGLDAILQALVAAGPERILVPPGE